MKNMRLPTRPAPSIEEARRKQNKNVPNQNIKKKPPPRPPPPDFTKMRSKSAWNLNQAGDNICLFEWSPPSSPKSTNRNFGGSISSSFSSSTSSLASSKKSFEYDTSPFNVTPWNFSNNTGSAGQGNILVPTMTTTTNPVMPQISVPTIIRPQPPKKPINKLNIKPVPSYFTSPSSISPLSVDNSPPMPLIPPPSPPKEVDDTVVPFGIALYDFPGLQNGDLPLQENDIVLLIKRIDRGWLYGKIGDKEGIFPANFIDIQIPLPEDNEKFVKAIFEFHPELPEDLGLKPGQIIKVLQRVSDEWLLGESNGQKGQFPANFVINL
ncbi:SH3 domain-containing protein [Oryctes borbonicus]|uniref:SH3 domain-containing protein n=1 Tax=Oryctes borbonicus TaxID=1629725 RepID=A0A0T6AT81_9SCAR|nr:SH3 domain-containing protein [Oryctes borbonicus]